MLFNPYSRVGVGGGGGWNFFCFVLDSCWEERSERAVTRARQDCGWAPLMGTGAAGGSAAPEQVHRESWDSAPRGACPPRAGGQQGPLPQNPLCADPCGKIQKPEAPLPSSLTPGDAESYMSTEKGCFSLALFLF